MMQMIRTLAVILIIMTTFLFIPEKATAQLETLVMPGEVIEGHAEIEADCDSCHASFARDKQRALCMDCHEKIAEDVLNRRGYHGLFNNARDNQCATCHTDHEGRDAQIVVLESRVFDHKLTNFALHGEHAELACADCHQQGDKYRNAPLECVACHEDDSVHKGALGNECGSCHASTGWRDVEFDHDATGFSLIGNHRQAVCVDCHTDRAFQPAPTACIDCHANDDVHEGKSGPECGNCHSPTDWLDPSFNHPRDTRFALRGSHANLTCSDCHSEEPFDDNLNTDCVSCHRADDSHDGHFGERCDSCHAATEWTDLMFNHARDVGHELLGSHATADCQSCHVEPIFEVSLSAGCNSCHAVDDPHEGTQGTTCNDCHNEIGWTDDLFFDHDLTRFPLLGAHGSQECVACHTSQVFRDASTACVDCHRDDDRHEGRLGDVCGLCHNPVDWKSWLFDHDTQTAFPLLGAHVAVECAACHRNSLQQQLRLGSRCADCHRSDDVHDGEFGADCGRCHSADSFEDVRSIR